MTTHRLKVLIKYADAIMNGTKTFEVRKNDRGYEVGDKIVFDVVTNEGYSIGEAARHPLNGATYRIDYIPRRLRGPRPEVRGAGHIQGGLMDEIELKPCPFCGGDAEMQRGKYQGLRTFYVSCLGCGARTDLEYAEEFAADLWNERVSHVE